MRKLSLEERLQKPSTVEARFDGKWTPEPNTGCWLWHGAFDGHGYGQIRDTRTRKNALAHRVSWEMNRGLIPVGFDIDHLCRVTCCVNPDHLEPVTRRENTRRGILNAVRHAAVIKRTHCKRGHDYATHGKPQRSGRMCVMCQRLKERERRMAGRDN